MWAEAEIMKADAETGESVPGATLQLIDYLGNVCDEWESTNEPHSFDKFESGREYTLHEKKAPAGYLPTEDITISISKNGVVTSSGTITDGVILMEDKQTELSISKREVGGDSELAGAEMKIYRAEDIDTDGSVKAGAAAMMTTAPAQLAHLQL